MQIRVLDVIEAADEVAGLAFQRNGSSCHHEYTIGHGQRLVNVLLDEQDRRTVVGRGAHRMQQTVDDERSKAERQFIDEQESTLPREAPGEREHLLLAARQESDAALEVRFELREQGQGTVDVAAADAQVLTRGQVHQYRARLRHHAEPLPGTHVQRRVSARAEETHLAAEGAQLSRQRRDRRRLAGAIRPEQRDHLALVDAQVEVMHDLDVPVARLQAVDFEDSGHAGPRGPTGCKLVASFVPR